MQRWHNGILKSFVLSSMNWYQCVLNWVNWTDNFQLWFPSKVTCPFLLQESIEELSELHNFKPGKATISGAPFISISWRHVTDRNENTG